MGAALLETKGIVGTDEENQLEYVEYPFRMLSKTYIPGYALDFSEGDVLRSAMAMFATKLFRNHDTRIESSIGITLNPRWTTSRGIEGVDAEYRIYRSFGQDVIDRLNAKVLDSTSVGINFLYKKSHKMDPDEFYENLGQTVNGQVVRFIVTKILSVSEASIVYAGADRDAKRLSQNEELYKYNLSPKGEKMEAEKIAELSRQVETQATLIKELTEKGKGILAENDSLKAKLAEHEPMVKLGEEYDRQVRDEAVKNYRLVTKEKAKEDMVKILQESPLDAVKLFAAEYKEQAEQMHPLVCAECGGKMTRASSVDAGLEQPSEPSGTKKNQKRLGDYRLPKVQE